MSFSSPEFFVHSKWFASSVPVYRLWCHLLWWTRLHFVSRDFVETPTPFLVPCPGTEPSIDFFSVEAHFLPSSPEISLKKVMALGFDRVFEIKACFRKDFPSVHHRPEFTMLEFYRPGNSQDQLIQETQDFLFHLCQNLRIPTPPVSQRSVAQLFLRYLDFPLNPRVQLFDLQDLCLRLGIYFQASDTIEDVFFRIWMDKIEPSLDPNELCFVTDYPSFQAAYASIAPSGWAGRVEVFWKGLELGNGFVEITDPDEQETRMRKDNDLRVRQSRPSIPLDEGFFEALRHGIPTCVGMALGLERVLMALTGVLDIGQIHDFITKSNT
ncbi:MAG: amino acid--tRNA ligase-related protein [Bdellovibrio sp.]